MDEGQLNTFISTLTPEQQEQFKGLTTGMTGKAGMEGGNQATIGNIPNIGNFVGNVETGINKMEETTPTLNEGIGEGDIENKVKGFGDKVKGFFGGEEASMDVGAGAEAEVAGSAASEAASFVAPVVDAWKDNPVKQDTGNLFEPSDGKPIQSRMGIAGDAVKSGGETFAKTGNPYAAAFAAVTAAVGGGWTRESNMRLKTKIDAQTKFMNAKADEHYSVYTDPNSVYYRGNKGYMGDSEGLA